MRGMRRRLLVLTAVTLAAVLGACVPSEQQDLAELEREGTLPPDAVAPTFPDVGNVAPDLVVDGIVHDLTVRPPDQDYWSPLEREARCAAERIVEDIGADRIAGLGYRPGTPGASLNDVDLTDEERRVVIGSFDGCIDLVEGMAAVLYGSGRMTPRIASCVASGLGGAGVLDAVVTAWASGRAVDPFAEDAEFAEALLGHAEVCIPAEAFNWPDVHLPDDEALIDSDLPPGSSRSAYVDDVTTTTTPPASAPAGDASGAPSTSTP